MSSNTQRKGRFKVHLSTGPPPNPNLDLILPFSWTAALGDLRVAAVERAKKLNFNPPNDTIPEAHLNGLDGGVLFEEDLLEDIILKPDQEVLWFVFGDGKGDDRGQGTSASVASSYLGRNQVEKGKNKHTPLAIRIITPELARVHKLIEHIPTLPSHYQVGSTTTLRSLKEAIASVLGIRLSAYPPSVSPAVECNCLLAIKILRGGTSEHARRCENITTAHKCGICNRDLKQACPTCAARGGVTQCQYLVHVGCLHKFHQHCAEMTDGDDRCPLRVQHTDGSANREYVPKDDSKYFLIVIYGRSNIKQVALPPPSVSSNSNDADSVALAFNDLKAMLRANLDTAVEHNSIVAKVFGAAIISTGTGRQIIFKNSCVISVCSRSKHVVAGVLPDTVIDLGESNPGAAVVTGPDSSSQDRLEKVKIDVDIYTTEAPISCRNDATTLGDLELEKSAVKGVVNLFVTVRTWTGNGSIYNGPVTGMDGMFRDNDHWCPLVKQTERGMATFLSATRLFATRIAKADTATKNSILALFMHLTHFPPILRALYCLINGKTLSYTESAVLIQCVFELTKEVVPGRIIDNKQDRVLEGSRLFFHIAMELARNFHNPSATEYLQSLKYVEMADADTFQPLLHPVATNIGVIEEAYYHQLTEGFLKDSVDLRRRQPSEEELKMFRLVRRTGGTMTGIVVFESDALQLALNESASTAVTAPEKKTSIPRAFTYNFKELCQQSATGPMAVIPPLNLRSRSLEAPALTLDGDGLLAVFTGRPPCAPPDQDVSIFRPTRGGEIAIDVSLVDQKLAPILQKRTVDGTIALDSLGEAEAKAQKSPEEVIVLCVDCSTSMDKPAGFEGVNEDDDSDIDTVQSDDDTSDDDVDDDIGTTYSIAEGQAALSAHECFQEIISTIRGKQFNWSKRKAASDILASIIQLYKNELTASRQSRARLESNFTSTYLRSAPYMHGNTLVQRIVKLEKIVECLTKVDTTKLVQYLLDMAARPSTPTSSDVSTRVASEVEASAAAGGNSLSIPQEFKCPICYELFKNPVIAEDGFTYEKQQIEQWFQSAHSSPMTGLPMGTVLIPNRNLTIQIREWQEAKNIIEREQSNPVSSGPEPTAKRNHRLIRVFIDTQASSFTFSLPERMRMQSLREICFRCLRGEATDFTLMKEGQTLPQAWSLPDDCFVVNLKERSRIFVQKRTNAAASKLGKFLTAVASGQSMGERIGDRVLVKVYCGGFNKPAFCFWILESTRSSLASILFRYWATHSGLTPDKYEVWTNLHDSGDNHLAGTMIDEPWAPLARIISRFASFGSPSETEPCYKKLSQEGEEKDEQEKKVKVLKLNLFRCSNNKKKKKQSKGKILTRMDVVKQIFDNYINRTLAYDFPNHIGLITFATRASVKQPITGVVEDLRNSLNTLQSGGDTALWDSFKLAFDIIETYSAQYPTAKKRVVCLSDGQDTSSKSEAWMSCQQFQDNNIVVDSIMIGKEDNEKLRAVSYGTGGYKFFPQDLESAVAICELETVLSQGERPEKPSVTPPLSKARIPLAEFRNYFLGSHSAVDVINEDTYPARKTHPNLQDEFISISWALRRSPNAIQNVGTMRLGEARILSEMRMIASNNQPYYDVYVSESNIRFWKVVMEAPADSTYAGGTYLLYLDMDQYYPSSAPKARFVTPIIHPNINKHGRVCHSILDRDWTSDTILGSLLNTIWSLLLVPNRADFANVVTSLNYLWDEVGHQDRVREHVRKHATKSRAQWRQEIVGY
ncbi:hypothetical protein BDZ91DRAFT_729114 [Kalaharituber pfeilii]|nr:hypothetical protein BDZ91DRAFT_729114 [Kalaharituber pfeilii]